jgi:hypothetical protein
MTPSETHAQVRYLTNMHKCAICNTTVCILSMRCCALLLANPQYTIYDKTSLTTSRRTELQI